MNGGPTNALLVRGLTGQPTPAELERQAAAGERPRSIHVEVARALDAEIIDLNFVEQHGGRASRFAARRVGILEGQVLTAFGRRNRYERIVAFADRLGLELALLWSWRARATTWCSCRAASSHARSASISSV